MRLLLFYFITVSILFSQENTLDILLDEYRNSQELYLKTKKESAGHITVYSRSDLDRMQAYTLNDVLKTLRMFSAQIDPVGMTSLIKAGGSFKTNFPIKIYIDSQELNSATLGNALSQYGKMGLYFIDHIEVYQGVNSIAYGNEPASMIIRLYTKKPSRENSTSAQIAVDTKASANLRVVDARVINDKYSYLINLDASKNNFKTYHTNNGYELSRDGQRGQFNFKFCKDSDYTVNISATKEEYDSFNGLGRAPLGGDIKNDNAYIQFIKYFDNNIELNFSASREDLYINMRDANGIRLYDGSMSEHLEAKVKTDVYYASLTKKFIEENNELILGLQAKQKKFTIDTFKSNNVDKALTWGPNKIDIYMAYFENLYNIDKNNLITMSAKLDHYDNEAKSSTENTLRLGYVGIFNKAWTLKVFGLKSYDYPIFRQTTFSPNTNINPYLKSAKTLSLTSEIIYKTSKTKTSFSYGSGQKKDAIVFNMSQNKYVNKSGKNRFDRAYLRHEYYFDVNNKIILDYYKMYKKVYNSPRYGGLIQIFNKVGKFDIYNELIYRSKYTSIDKVKMSESFNYSLGLTYHLNKKTELKIKGENLFDKSLEVPINGIDVASNERRGIISLEYTF